MRGLKILSTGRNETLRQPFGCLRFTVTGLGGGAAGRGVRRVVLCGAQGY